MSEGVHSGDLSSGLQQAPVHLSYSPIEFLQNFLVGSDAQSRQVVNVPANGTGGGEEGFSGFYSLSYPVFPSVLSGASFYSEELSSGLLGSLGLSVFY